MTEIKAKAKFEVNRILGTEHLTKLVVDADLGRGDDNHGKMGRVSGKVGNSTTLPEFDLGG